MSLAATFPVQSPLAARAAAGLPAGTVDVPMTDADQARYHLCALSGSAGMLVELRRRTATGMQSKFFTDYREAAELAVVTGAQTDVYMGVLPRVRPSGGKDALAPAGRWMWAECDTQAAVAKALNMRSPPPLVVRSSLGKAHCYWPLLGWVPWQLIERGNRRLAWELGADMRACDAARILRIAGTRNHKYEVPQRVSITVLDMYSDMLPSSLVAHLPDPTPPRPTPVVNFELAGTRVRLDRKYGPDATKDAILAVPSRVYVERLTGRAVYHHMATCPFHGGGQERTPSFHVAGPNETLWHCFGCDEGGDVFTFAARLWGMDVERDFPTIKTKLKELL